MNAKSLVVATLFGIVPICCCLAVQVDQPPGGELAKVLGVELTRIKTALELDEAWIQQLEERVAADLAKANKRWEKGCEPLTIITEPNRLDRVLQKALFDQAAHLIPAEGREQLQRYVDDRYKTNELDDHECRLVVVRFFDRYLSLSVQQQHDLTDLLKKQCGPVLEQPGLQPDRA